MGVARSHEVDFALGTVELKQSLNVALEACQVALDAHCPEDCHLVLPYGVKGVLVGENEDHLALLRQGPPQVACLQGRALGTGTLELEHTRPLHAGHAEHETVTQGGLP